MDIVKDWEALVSDLKRRMDQGDESCRPLLMKAKAELKAAREKKTKQEQKSHGH